MEDFVVVGGGVIGLSIAYELSRTGSKVRVIERGAPGREASWAGAGILPAAGVDNVSEPIEQLRARSGVLHEEWATALREETGIDTGYRVCGGVYVARDDEARKQLETAVAYWQWTGVKTSVVDGRAMRDIERGLSELDDDAQCAVVEAEAQLRNPWHLRALEAACRRRGVTIDVGEEVVELVVRNGRVSGVVTTGRTIEAAGVCVAGGAWSGRLLADVGVDVPIRPVRGQIALLRGGEHVPRRVINEGSRYVVPRADGRTLVGSTEDDAGFDKRTTTEGIAGLLEFGQSLVAGLASAEVERTWAGLRPGSEHGMPYLGRIGRLDNGYVATGHFRSGLFLSTGTAEAMGQLIRGEETSVDLSGFAVADT